MRRSRVTIPAIVANDFDPPSPVPRARGIASLDDAVRASQGLVAAAAGVPVQNVTITIRYS